MIPPRRACLPALLAVHLLACSTEPQRIEAQLTALQLRTQERQAAGDTEGALALVQEMAALDPGHPKPYIRLVLIEHARGTTEQVPEQMDRLGLRDAAGRLYAEGMLAYFRDARGEAEGDFSRALDLYTARQHAAGEAACHTALGMLRSEARSFDAAVAAFEAAIPLLEQVRDRWGLADVHGNLAGVERDRGDAAAGLEHQRRVLALREDLGDREGQAGSWYEIGAALARSGAAAEAVAAYERAQSLHLELGDTAAQVADLRAIASVLLEAGSTEDALARLRSALAITAAGSDRSLGAEVSRQLGETLVEVGRAREGAEMLEGAIAAFDGLKAQRLALATRVSLGRARLQLGELTKALRLLEGSLAAAEGMDDTALIADAAIALGNLRLSSGEPVQALLLEERAVELLRRMEDRAGERIALHNLGAVYFALGDLARSRASIEDALRLAEELHDAAAAARARNTLGVILAAEGRLDPARTELEAAATAWEALGAARSRALTDANLAEVLTRLGRREEAAARLAQALAVFREVGDPEGEAFAANLRGDLLLAEGDPQAALDAHRQALDLAEEHGFADERLQAHAGMAAALRARGELGPATSEAMLALDEIERLRASLAIDAFKSRFLAGKMSHYERALDLLIGGAGAPAPEATAAAFHVAERGRARSLVDLLAESGMRLGDPRYAEVADARPLTLAEVREELLDEGEVLLEYFIGDEKAWLWRIDRRGAALVPLPPPAEIRDAVGAWLAEIESARLAGAAPEGAAAERVARALLPPEPLPAGVRVIVVPDGPLHHIPFEALPSGGRLLIQEHEVVVAPSATALAALRRRPRATASGFLGIADPIPAAGDERFSRLPYSREEVEAIAGLFPPASRTLLVGEAATKERLRALPLDRFRFVHFASHAWVDPDDMRRSGLRLSAAADDAGSALLSLDEIAELDLAAELVVISACRSGGGELLRGEGLVGLTRAFLYAGARAVVVSLWDVGDRSTAEFMRLFYRGLESGQPPAAALRGAKLAFLSSPRQTQRSIRQWAPFILVGDPQYPGQQGGTPTATRARPVPPPRG